MEYFLCYTDTRKYLSRFLSVQPKLSLKMLKWIDDGENFVRIRKRKVSYSSFTWNLHEDKVEENMVSLLDVLDVVWIILFRTLSIFVVSLWITSKRLPLWLRRRTNRMVVSIYSLLHIKLWWGLWWQRCWKDWKMLIAMPMKL